MTMFRMPFHRVVFACQRYHTGILNGLPLPMFLPVGHRKDEQRIMLLEGRVEAARNPRDRSTYERAKKRVERMHPNGNLRCSRCELVKAPSSFHNDSRRNDGKHSHCKECHAQTRLYYEGFTFRGVMRRSLHAAKINSCRRGKRPLRKEAGRFELDFDYLLNLWLQQKGRCAYSGIVMNVERGMDWRLSLERFDNTRGYVAGNVAFICAEFNTVDTSLYSKHHVSGSCQWSKEKVLFLPERIYCTVPLSTLELDANRSPEKLDQRRKLPSRKFASDGNLVCTLCESFKPIADFYVCLSMRSGRTSRCKHCLRVQARQKSLSFEGFLKGRIHSAKGSAASRYSKGRLDAGMFDFTFQDIVNKYNAQRGLCYYSGVKMRLAPSTDWMLSVERLDNKKGYVQDNVVLICGEFQTSDHCCGLKDANIPIKGSPQWSKEKVDMLTRWISCLDALPPR